MSQELRKELHPFVEPPAPEMPQQNVGASSRETTAEQVITPETGKQPNREGLLDETIESLRHTLRRSKKTKKTHIPQVRDALTVQVERLMEEGLEDAFRAMTTVQQQEFKLKGEETAYRIRALLQKARVRVKKIFRLLLKWLKLIPGVNKFFLMQEAKIKTDKIIALK